MKTLKELIDEHGINIRVRRSVWKRMYFKIMYIHEGCVYGHYDDGNPSHFLLDGPVIWQLYTEPKPKVMRAQYMVKYKYDCVPYETDNLYKDDEEFFKFHPRKSEREWYKRLEERECES
jgi:hypothetical protein